MIFPYSTIEDCPKHVVGLCQKFLQQLDLFCQRPKALELLNHIQRDVHYETRHGQMWCGALAALNDCTSWTWLTMPGHAGSAAPHILAESGATVCLLTADAMHALPETMPVSSCSASSKLYWPCGLAWLVAYCCCNEIWPMHRGSMGLWRHRQLQRPYASRLVRTGSLLWPWRHPVMSSMTQS